MLKFEVGVASYLIAWTKKLRDYSYRELGQLGHIVEYEEYYVHPDVDLPLVPYTDRTDPFRIMRQALSKKVDMREQLIDQMLNNRPKLYACIWSHISVESEEQVKFHGQYTEANRDKDPLLLLNIIRATHLGGRVANNIEAGEVARRGYNRLIQQGNESISAFQGEI